MNITYAFINSIDPEGETELELELEFFYKDHDITDCKILNEVSPEIKADFTNRYEDQLNDIYNQLENLPHPLD